jgi:hypothetical protein
MIGITGAVIGIKGTAIRINAAMIGITGAVIGIGGTMVGINAAKIGIDGTMAAIDARGPPACLPEHLL